MKVYPLFPRKQPLLCLNFALQWLNHCNTELTINFDGSLIILNLKLSLKT